MFLSRIKSNKFIVLKWCSKKNLKFFGEVSFLNKGYMGKQVLYLFLKSIYGLHNYWVINFLTLLGLHSFSVIGTIGIFLLKIEQISLKHFQLQLYLKKSIRDQVKFLKDQRTYAGVRLLLGLPVRGQRTHTNHNTIRRLVSRTLLTKTKRQARKLLIKKGKK